jgi:hypothetical protein
MKLHQGQLEGGYTSDKIRGPDLKKKGLGRPKIKEKYKIFLVYFLKIYKNINLKFCSLKIK